jgi:anti-sigma factor RsiW
MHEDLLGYLLGALEPHEMRRVARLIQEDPAIRAELAEIERALAALEGMAEPNVEPVPADLVSRTLAGIPPLPKPGTIDATLDSLVPMHPGIEVAGPHHSSWLDWIGGAAAMAAILGLLIPALAEGRMEARKVACQAHLRQLGTAITQFVNRDPQHRLPAVAESGPEAFAGMYAVRLSDAGLLTDAAVRWCPTMQVPQPSSITLTPIGKVESVAELHRATVDRLREIQQYAGGHYAYTLGVVDRNRLRPPRFESRSSFAIMSDAPPVGFFDRDDLQRLMSHGGRGINVLFEDGRVQFMMTRSLNTLPDHPLLNHHGRAEAGVNIDDASLAPSWVAPFINAVQR